MWKDIQITGTSGSLLRAHSTEGDGDGQDLGSTGGAGSSPVYEAAELVLHQTLKFEEMGSHA